MFKLMTMAVVALTAGLLLQNYTGVLNSFLNKEIQVYSKPIWYSVSRMGTTVRYQAEGERYIECTHKAPLTADFLDKNGFVVSRELVRRAVLNNNTANYSSLPDIKEPTNEPITPSANGGESIIGTPQTDPKPHKFKINHFIIVTDAKTMEESTEFVLRAECFNPTDGRVLGKFGPFPIPKDGDTLGYFPDVVKKPENLLPITPSGS